MLKGLKISASGADYTEREQVSAAVASHGAVSSQELNATCTHLLLYPGGIGGAKHTFALKRGVQVVWHAWLFDSLAAGRCLPEADYPCPRDSTNGAAMAKAVQITHVEGTELHNKGSRLLPAGTKQQMEPSQSVVNEGHQSSSCLQEPQDPIGDMSEMFLDMIRIFMACGADELRPLVLACRAGAATRYDTLQPCLTHILIGRQASADQLQQVKEFCKSQRSKPHLVNTSWLEQCVRSRRLLPVQTGHRADLAAADASAQGAPAALAADIIQDQRLRAAPAGTQPPATAAVSQPAADKFFNGCYFTLAGLKDDRQEEQAASKLIRSLGGKIFSKDTMNTVVSWHRAYAVCASSLPKDKERLLCRLPDFKRVPPTMRVTSWWLCRCERARSLQSHKAHDELTSRPFEFPLPVPGMDAVRLCASGYSDPEKEKIKVLTNMLGGKYSTALRPTSTHLVIDKAVGAKYDSCARLEVVPVTIAWLWDVARQGRLMQSTDYIPFCVSDLNGSQNADPALPSCNPEISQQVDALQLGHFTQCGSKRGRLADRDLNAPTSFQGLFPRPVQQQQPEVRPRHARPERSHHQNAADGSEDQLSSAVERLETALTCSGAPSAPDLTQASQGSLEHGLAGRWAGPALMQTHDEESDRDRSAHAKVARVCTSSQMCFSQQVGYADNNSHIRSHSGSTANDEYFKQRLAAIVPQDNLGPVVTDDLKDIGLML
ncbi:hypothetical protein WJX74_001847 [Apatococcus lobatus]|uniref:BRCT domain-containing protein n=1 Tax=Apatococcus lobatus TaxID=904363 RepID=A0AAW1R1Z9_9CHLO